MSDSFVTIADAGNDERKFATRLVDDEHIIKKTLVDADGAALGTEDNPLQVEAARGPWHEVGDVGEPAFQNSWDNGAAGPLSVYGPLRYYTSSGRIYFQGVVTGGTPGFAGSGVVCTFDFAGGYSVPILNALSISDDFMSSGTATVAYGPTGDLVVFAADEDNVFLDGSIAFDA